VGRRVALVVIFFVAAIASIAMFAVAPTAINNRAKFGTFDTAGPPPRVDYCGRRYYPGSKTESRAEVEASLAQHRSSGWMRIDTAPAGRPIFADVMPPAVRAQYHTNACAMELWVQSGPDAYRPYVLSGGP
jgi:hypothetical protein